MTAHRPLLCAATLLLAAVAFPAAAQNAAKLPADLDAKSLARLPYLQRKDVTDEVSQEVFDIFDRSKGRDPEDTLTGPLAFAGYNGYVAKALHDLHDGAVGQSALNPHVRELAILVACRETNYSFEFNGHEPAAVKAGVDPKVVDVVRNNGAVTGLDEADAAVIRFGRAMLRDRKMDSATFAKAVELFGKKGAMDLVAVMSTYAVSGFYAIAVDEHPQAGRQALPMVAK